MQSTSTSAPTAHDSTTIIPLSGAQKEQSAFERALSEYLRARKLMDGMEPGSANDDFFTDAFIAAEERLIDTPANSIEELRIKFDVVWGEDGSTPGERILLKLLADLRRMTGDAPSRIFDPERWLKRFEDRGGMYCVRDGEVFLLTPAAADLRNAMYRIEASGGRDAVHALIRQRTAREAAHGDD